MTITIRQEQIEDYVTTEKVVKTAFEGMELSDQTEHELVARIRGAEVFVPELSLVAVDDKTKEIIGHILLSKMKIVNKEHAVESLALAPVSVLPEYQKKGIGKRLMHEALNKAKELGYKSVIVMGHPEYYPKFGFKKASLWDINPPFDVPDEAFMALPLEEHALDNVSGVVEYPSVFFE
ncbi:GCN5 family acetyltransferase [Lysinibacillus contaminans]|uniref:GCN5 family acetyltransferase n=1 Tax=Lysinibacillus contaminans TaxID=1293441 RepID=A0ABR5JZQ1_9BACI|nr:N-acetyltransferase [Lysinibacillus contaminans]KOS67975.1 GCN5 family acetyltransferase [Lysinibacillus contaminans]